MSFSLSGNAGVAGATVSWSGTTSGSVVADASGNYSAPGVLTSGGSYTLQASKTLYTFSPTSVSFPNTTSDIIFNFTATPIPMARVVQKAVQINTAGGATATATFAKPLTAGNALVVAVMAVDTGGAVATDAHGATSHASVTDSQGNALTAAGASPSIYGDRTNNKTLFAGIYYINFPWGNGGVAGAADAVTFTFTPVSSASNCQVGIVAYEVTGFNTPSDTAATLITGENGSAGVYPGNFPPRVNGDITLISSTYGIFFIVAAVATTSDGSAFNVGPENAFDPYGQGPVGELGWTLDGSSAANINSTHSAIAVQSEFATGTGADNPCAFGSSPSSSVGLASAACAMGFALLNVPYQAPTITTPSNLPNGSQVQSYAAPLTLSGGSAPYTWAVISGSLPAGLLLNPSTGVISGTPAGSGTFNFTVQVTDSIGGTATKSFSMVVAVLLSGGGGSWQTPFWIDQQKMAVKPRR